MNNLNLEDFKTEAAEIAELLHGVAQEERKIRFHGRPYADPRQDYEDSLKLQDLEREKHRLEQQQGALGIRISEMLTELATEAAGRYLEQAEKLREEWLLIAAINTIQIGPFNQGAPLVHPDFLNTVHIPVDGKVFPVAGHPTRSGLGGRAMVDKQDCEKANELAREIKHDINSELGFQVYR